MKTIGKFLAILVLVLGAAHAAEAQDDAIDWLMVVQGEVTAVGADQITLSVPSSAIVFSDRPDRLVRLIDLGDFVAGAWGPDGELRPDPPNAALVNENEDTVAVIEITDMAVADGVLTIQLTVLEGALPEAGDEIAVTIDAFPTAVNSQITDAITQA